MPFINVKITKDGVSAEQKRAVIKGITDVMVKVLGKSPENTHIVIDEVDTDNWGHKGNSVSELRKAAAAATAKATKAAKVKAAPKAKATKPKKKA
ncbi:MAG: tautomerase family protein [Devosia sp.]